MQAKEKRLTHSGHSIDTQHTSTLCDVHFFSIYNLWCNIHTYDGLTSSYDFHFTLTSTKFRLDLLMFSELNHVDRRRDTLLTSCASCIERMMTPKLKLWAVCHKPEQYMSRTDDTMTCVYNGGCRQ
jgi:hypothetical protein